MGMGIQAIGSNGKALVRLTAALLLFLAATTVGAQSLDRFGVKMLFATAKDGRVWTNHWNEGAQRALDWGPDDIDPQFLVRGDANCTIYGASGTNSGQIKVTGAAPRLYVRGSPSEAVPPPTGTPKWKNVEVTFYARTVSAGGKVSYAGIEAVCRTNHLPDSDDPTTPGYGGRVLFDGRTDIEKELSHGKGSNIQSYPSFIWAGTDGGLKSPQANLVSANGGKPVYELPLDKWIGYKLVTRNSSDNSEVQVEVHIDKTGGVGGGDWVLAKSVRDIVYSESAADRYFSKDLWYYGSDFKSKGSATPAQHGKPLIEANYSVYLRTDGDAEQYYKAFTVREIDPLPVVPVSLLEARKGPDTGRRPGFHGPLGVGDLHFFLGRIGKSRPESR